jgi:hypothetical protein
MLPLWYMRLSWPERYGLSEGQAPAVLAEARRVIEEHGITHVAEGGSNSAGWLANLATRYGVQ